MNIHVAITAFEERAIEALTETLKLAKTCNTTLKITFNRTNIAISVHADSYISDLVEIFNLKLKLHSQKETKNQ